MKKIILLVLLILSTLYYLPHVAASPSAVIQNTTHSIDAIGDLHVFGEVQNTGDVWLNFVKISAVLKNVTGQTVDFTYTFTYANYLAPGQKSPFNLIETDAAKSAKVTVFDLTLEYSQTTTFPSNSLVIQSPSGSIDSIGYYNIVGTVKNNGPHISNFTEIIATFYDSAGLVVYAGFTFTSPTDVPPGQTLGFKVIGPNQPISGRVAKFTLSAESTQYSSVPEFPWPAILLALALSLGCFALRRKRA